jgi:hypothetical protein
MNVSDGEALGHELVSALAAQDWTRLERCFASDARLFAACDEISSSGAPSSKKAHGTSWSSRRSAR